MNFTFKLYFLTLTSALVQLISLSLFANEIDTLKKGAALYRSCYYCHSLKEDVHLTGPSLANLWNGKAGEIKTFKLYSEALKTKAPQWNEENLKTWIQNPQQLVPETSMTFKGLKDKDSVNQLISFLKLAMSPEGYKKVIEQGLLDQETADGQLPQDVSNPTNANTVTSVEHCENVYFISTADGKKNKYWEMNLDFKVNSGAHGPQKGKPVIISSGSMGDRFTLLFKSTQDLKKILKPCAINSKLKKKN